MLLVYKICAAAEWQAAVEDGAFTGSAADRTLVDGTHLFPVES